MTPDQKTPDSRGRYENKPKPNKYKDLFIEEVDGQSALDGVLVSDPKMADGDVTHGNPWEAMGNANAMAIIKFIYDFKAIHAIGGPEETIEQKDLTHGVGDVDELHY